jgi:ubiquinone/menaquinone biosynthesis C-methylase UbiE
MVELLNYSRVEGDSMFRARDREKCRQLYDKYYHGRKFHDAFYRDLIRKHLEPGQRLLDAGCGRYMAFCKEFCDIAEVVGIDCESALETKNNCAPFAVRGDISRLPFPDGYFDMIISRSVIEHLEDPPEVFKEFCRVLRPGGKVIILTPNKYDYVSLIAALTPYSLHRRLVSKLFQVSEDDVFPTLYRANTFSSIRKAFRAAGLIEKQMTGIGHYPAYLMFSPVLFRLGVVYERLISLDSLKGMRGTILGLFEKQKTVPAAMTHRDRWNAQTGSPAGVS